MLLSFVLITLTHAMAQPYWHDIPLEYLYTIFSPALITILSMLLAFLPPMAYVLKVMLALRRRRGNIGISGGSGESWRELTRDRSASDRFILSRSGCEGNEPKNL
ncbi:MAG: hypothetical protein QI197_08165 [Candidatus Korarchaeota archaeon]|nr:hypothetical protein [Candidatus Korarchaeota archaeon]